MKHVSRYLTPSFCLTIAVFAVLVVVAAAHPAYASPTSSHQSINFDKVSNALDDFFQFLTGPIVRITAVVMVLGGIFLLIQGQEMGNAVRVLLFVVVGLGLLANIGAFLGSGASIVDTSMTHAMIVAAPTHHLVHAR